jgi:hypothetical protein
VRIYAELRIDKEATTKHTKQTKSATNRKVGIPRIESILSFWLNSPRDEIA